MTQPFVKRNTHSSRLSKSCGQPSGYGSGVLSYSLEVVRVCVRGRCIYFFRRTHGRNTVVVWICFYVSGLLGFRCIRKSGIERG